jgi:hypothetical protein
MREMVMSQQPVSESVLTNNYRCATLAHVSRRFLGRLRSCRAPEARLRTPDGSVDIQWPGAAGRPDLMAHT